MLFLFLLKTVGKPGVSLLQKKHSQERHATQQQIEGK
jgi:hypothetical protein